MLGLWWCQMAHFWTIWCYFANIFNSFSFLRCWLITLLWTRYNNSRDIALGYNVIITRCIRMEFGNRVPMNGRGMWEQVLGIAANPDSREPGEGCHRVQPSLTPTDWREGGGSWWWRWTLDKVPVIRTRGLIFCAPKAGVGGKEKMAGQGEGQRFTGRLVNGLGA